MDKLSEELREASLHVSQAILNDGSMSVSGEWATLFDEAAERIKKLEATDEAACYAASVYETQKKEIEALQKQLDEIREACRETSDDWSPEHPPYAAQDLIERITGIMDSKDVHPA